ncbi:MAG: tetratricopeptide repeat protein [Candidatus Krumholzibacteriota bacterium]
MLNPSGKFLLILMLSTSLSFSLSLEAGFPGVVFAYGQDQDPPIVEDEEVPPGVASSWVIGHRLLIEGNTADALPYLHQAYRAHPDVILIAMDFQAALAQEGYLRDALNVMDSLVSAWPDSQSFRLRRSALNLTAGDRDKALEDLREIRRQGNSSVDVLAAEAAILARDGETAQAIDVLRDGLHLHPERGRDIYLEMSRIMRQAEQSAGIPPLMDEALVRYPDEPMLWLVKMRSLAELSLHEEALAVAREADLHFSTLAAPDTTDPVDPTEIDEFPREAPFPGMPADSFSVELADYYAQHNQIDQALAILQPLAEKGSLGLRPSLWLGRLLLGTGHEQEGAELVEQILTKWPDAGRGWYLRGKVEESTGNWDGAVDYYRKAVVLDPYDPEIRLGIVRAMLVAWERDLRASAPDTSQRAKLDEFRVQTMTATTLVPEKDTEGQMMLGYSFRALKDLERAAWRFSLAAENPDLRLTALIQKSICHDENGEEAKARNALELLRREFPQDPEVANSLGYFLAEKGKDLDLAEGLVREALEVDPGNGAYLDSLGWVMYRKGRFEDAFDFLIQAVNVLPDDPVILEHLGMVLIEQGQASEALDVLKRALALGGDPDRIGTLIGDIENAREEKE